MAEDNPSAPGGVLSNSISRVPPVNPVMPRPGELFAGRYEVERMLGRGGMGEVYAAVQRPLGRRVAVKILKTPDSIDDDPNFQGRFLREAAAAARLTHPNTITVFDFGQTDDGVLFIVMEYLEGNDVRTVLRHEGQMTPQRSIHVAKQVCKSLREAHRKGIVHRDLKPANVLLVERDDDPDFAKVLDFGLVKFRGESSEITLAGKFLGSPRYTSPEALDRNKEVDHRADIYAVGILLYAMITGNPPFDGDAMQVLNAHLHEIPQPMYKAAPSARTTPELEEVVEKCLQKEPDRRFQSMSELLTALRKVASFYGDHDTETIDFDTAEESIELDESVSPGRPLPVPASAGDAILQSTGKMRAVPVDPAVAAASTAPYPALEDEPAASPEVAEPSPERTAKPKPKQRRGKKAAPPSKKRGSMLPGLLVGAVLAIGVIVSALRPEPEPDPAPADVAPVDVAPVDVAPVDVAPVDVAPEATPEPTPEPVTKPTPAPVAKPRPRPVRTPPPAPVARPTPTPEPTPKPADDTAVPGYKDNPYD